MKVPLRQVYKGGGYWGNNTAHRYFLYIGHRKPLMIQYVEQEGGILIRHMLDTRSHMSCSAEVLTFKKSYGNAGISNINC